MNKILETSRTQSRCTVIGRIAMFSTESAAKQIEDSNFIPTYIHYISKTVLLHLQDSRFDWLQREGLDRGLRINPNGTFVLQFPAKRNYDSGRIWTTYESATKAHWLSVYRHKFVGRFLLRDSTKENSINMHAHIHSVVDHMIEAVEHETKRRRTARGPPPTF